MVSTMYDGQHHSQASVGSNVLLRKPARMRVELSATEGVLSALTPLPIKEASFLLSENRQASERQEHAHKSRRPIVRALGYWVRLRVTVSLWPGYSVIVSLALVATLRCVWSTGAEPPALWVQHVRVNHKGDVGKEGPSVGRSGVSERLVVSRPGGPDRVFDKMVGWPFDDGAWSVSIGGDSTLIGKDLGKCQSLLSLCS